MPTGFCACSCVELMTAPRAVGSCPSSHIVSPDMQYVLLAPTGILTTLRSCAITNANSSCWWGSTRIARRVVSSRMTNPKHSAGSFRAAPTLRATARA